jgi:hypothetical protein
MRYLPIVLTFAATALAQSPNFVGARGCNASNCHGYDTERKYSPETRIYGNEYTTWRGSDKHRDAAKVLQDTRGKRMAAILNISDATKDKRCAVCHVVGSPEDQRMDGVSCEACHGPAAQWRDSHRAANSHKDSVSKGMTDTKNPLELTKLCMSCHVGSGDRIVDHEMIAAGHPDLAFEIDTFEAAEPSHHRPDPAGTQAENKKRLQNWAIGQANAMATGMSLMATHERSWPEFSDLECYQCHHI